MKTKTQLQPNGKAIAAVFATLLILLFLALRNSPFSMAWLTYACIMGAIWATVALLWQARYVMFAGILLISLGVQFSDAFFSPPVREQFRLWIDLQYICFSMLSFFCCVLIVHLLRHKQAPRETNDATPS